MRVVFAGTPAFAATALQAILDAGFEVPTVFTQPDRPAGRGQKLLASAVKTLALERGLAVEQPLTLRDPAAQARLAHYAADVMVVAAYGLILPQTALDLPRFGCLNIHASLLPRWRGAAPIQRAIAAGDLETGVCIMQMEAGLDTGPVLATARTPIDPSDTTASLHDRLALIGGEQIVATLDRLRAGQRPPAIAQPTDGITYAAKVTGADTVLDWRSDARSVERCVRAFGPRPGLRATLGGEALKIVSARVIEAQGAAGSVLRADAGGFWVACGAGALALEQVQRAGGTPMRAAAFLAGLRAPLPSGFDLA